MEGRKEDRALRTEAEESGLYQYKGIGESSVDESKIMGASDEQLQAIVRHGDVSDDQKLMLLKVLDTRQKIGAGGPVSGEQISDASMDVKDATESVGDVNIITTTTDASIKTNQLLNFNQDAKEDDRVLQNTSGLNLALDKL